MTTDRDIRLACTSPQLVSASFSSFSPWFPYFRLKHFLWIHDVFTTPKAGSNMLCLWIRLHQLTSSSMTFKIESLLLCIMCRSFLKQTTLPPWQRTCKLSIFSHTKYIFCVSLAKSFSLFISLNLLATVSLKSSAFCVFSTSAFR